MSITNPYNITIAEVMAYLDTLAIKEETQALLINAKSSDYERDKRIKNTRIAQLLLRISKKAAANKVPGCIQLSIEELPEA